jgi:hypothetical protein
MLEHQAEKERQRLEMIKIRKEFIQKVKPPPKAIYIEMEEKFLKNQ